MLFNFDLVNLMKILHQIFEERPFGYRRDNPGGDWLMYKQRNANDPQHRPDFFKKLTGSITAWMGSSKPMLLPVDALKTIPGARGERRRPGEYQFDHLMKQVKYDPYGFNNRQDPILIGVNHDGDAYVIEGNTRIAVAAALDVKYIFAEIRYWNGGEDVDGPWSPKRVFEIGKSPL